MSHPAVAIENLSKAYRIGLEEQRHDTLVGSMMAAARYPLRNFHRLRRLNTFRHCDESDDMFWALRDVSFEVAEGEVVGIIGRNGAGKSTLLKVLSRITEPTSGRAVIRGRVSSLLEVGTGFHQELTGRENVYMNGTILGMTKREIDRKFDQIVDFSGVEKFLDTPIKHYSSGMKVRLAFSVAAHLEPEILIIDEVLAVGDLEFQKKCLGKMQDVAAGGRTVLFVSHNMSAVQALCSCGVLLKNGRMTIRGDVEEVIERYQDEVSTFEADVDLAHHAGRTNGKSSGLKRVRLVADEGLTSSVPAKGRLTVEADFHVENMRFAPVLGVVVRDALGTPLFGINNRLVPAAGMSDSISRGTIRCSFSSIPLTPGRYKIDLYLGDTRSDFDIVMGAAEFQVTPTHLYSNGKFPPRSAGPFLHDAEFEVVAAEFDGSSI